jgi:hypothetical protein
MINLKTMLSEASHAATKTHGCLMAMVEAQHCSSIIDFGKKLVSEDTLYTAPGYGREDECHVTILFGFKPDINELQIRRIIQGIKPFTIRLKSISQFHNSQFDVVKFDVESEDLVSLNERSKNFPFESDYPVYHPHMTIAYVKPGTFPFESAEVYLSVPIKKICYSPIAGAKTYYDLSENQTSLDELKNFDVKKHYHVDNAPNTTVKDTLEGILKDIKQLIYELGFKGVSLNYVTHNANKLATYSGMLDTHVPIITFATRVFKNYVKRADAKLEVELERILVHELGHAYLDANGLDIQTQLSMKSQVERLVDDFGEAFEQTRNIRESKAMLDRFIEEYEFQNG